jgi:acetylornithine deacetylase/succinyl-diaminopimelate desuccinylase-like protein
MKIDAEQLNKYVNGVRPDFEQALTELVGIPTVGADPAHASDTKRGADLAVQLLTDAGFTAEAVDTPGHPVVFGRLIQNPKYPTVTIYNHLDVQPADPAEWQTQPFKLTIKGDRYYGRGATDDKGPALTALMAVVFAHEHKLPINFHIIWELEEEMGSPSFEHFVKTKQKQLATDSIIVADTVWIASGKPAVPLGLRGLMAFEISLRTAKIDVHSGSAGGVARNPLGELAQIITECYDAASGHVNIPGFYDAVQPPTSDELDNFLASGFNVKQFMADHELESLRTSDPTQVLSHIMAEPTFEVHGLSGGYTGPGVKTIVPAAATAKISTRLVPNQNPRQIFDLIKGFITKRHPDVKIELKATLDPFLMPQGGRYAEAAATAIEAAFGIRPAFVREGGSIGAVLTMAQHLNVPISLLGLSLPEHAYHAPNEFYDWGQAAGGIKMFAYYFAAIAQIPGHPDGSVVK